MDAPRRTVRISRAVQAGSAGVLEREGRRPDHEDITGKPWSPTLSHKTERRGRATLFFIMACIAITVLAITFVVGTGIIR